MDNNANGLIDCNDPTCIGTGTCESPIVEICNDSIDNNGDGLLDCDDPLCSTSSYCLPETCDDGVDNNGDSLIDCNDPTCADTSICRPPPVEICEDGIDNDANGLIDCDDAKCTDLPACTPPVLDELCNNGADDDGDGYIDCADPQCQDRAVCLDESCENDDDDDGDGRVDCEDLECRETPACSGQLGGVSLDFSVRASKEKDGYEAENAGDHDLVSRWWVDKDHRQWLMLDLGGRYPIDRVDIHWHSSLYADKYKIRVSRNKRHWRTVASVTNGAGGLESSIFETRGARFVLIQCKTPASSGYSIHEVEVFRSATDVDDHH
ncbi:MAG: discoidin domain-containing protein [Candidatus Thiodiazotropha sp.]